MKQKLLLAILAILFPVSAFCTDWLSAEVCGTEMSFYVLSEEDKTCAVAAPELYDACIDESYVGEIVLPSEVNGYTLVKIEFTAFYKCTGVTSVTIPNTVKTIDRYAFYGCI